MKQKFFLIVVFIIFLLLPQNIFAACPAGCSTLGGNIGCYSGTSGAGSCTQSPSNPNLNFWNQEVPIDDCGVGACQSEGKSYCLYIQSFLNCGGCCWPDAPPPSCSLSTPLNPRVYLDETTVSSAKLRWNSPTTKGTELRVRLDSNQNDVENGCPGTGTCLIKENGLNKNSTSFNTATAPSPPVSLSPGRRYYWRVINWTDSTCNAPSATDSFITDCQVSLNSATEPFVTGTSQTITATVTANASLIDHVKLSMPANSFAHLSSNPKNDSTVPYNVNVFGDSAGTTTLNANVYYGPSGSSRCSTSIPINITSLYTLEAKAHKITDINASCSTIVGAPALKPTDFSLEAGSTNYPQSATQNTNAAISIPNLTIGTDTVINSLPVPPPPYQTVKYCRSIIPLPPPPPPPWPGPGPSPTLTPTPTPSYTVTNVASGQAQDDTVRFDVGIINNSYTLQTNVHDVTDPNATCDTIAATPYSLTSPLFPKTIALTVDSTNAPQSGTQTNGTPVSFPNLALGTDTLDTTAPSGYALVKSCLSNTANPGVYTQTDTTTGQAPSDTMLFDVGYIKNTYTFQSFAHEITDVSATCADIQAAPKLNGVTFFLSSPSSANDPQSGVTSGNPPVTFADLPIAPINPQDYLESTPPAGYAVVRYCLSKSSNGGPFSPSVTSDPPVASGQQPNDVFQFDVGYVYGTPWVQVQGGDVTVNTSISSPVPDSVVPESNKMFLTSSNAPNGILAGLVTYGTTADFDSSPGTGGGIPDKVSPNKWLLNESYATKDYYTKFYNKLGAPTTADADYTEALNIVTQPPFDPDLVPPKKYYYVNGDMETSGTWSVATGESYVFIVNGNLTIKTPITRTGTGFIAFVVKGNITIDPSLGVTPISETPVIEGLYVTDGTFLTGSSIAGKEEFVGKGIFNARRFTLERNLDVPPATGNNARYPSELFIFDPQLPFLLPDPFRENSITWQEVAP